jgi:hypothetical protein
MASAPENIVTSISYNGLCNRLRGMATSLILAQALSYGFRAAWPDGGSGDTHFLDLFEDPGFAFLDGSGIRQPTLRPRCGAEQPWVRLNQQRDHPASTGVEGSLLLDQLPPGPFRLATWLNLRPSSISDDEFLSRKVQFLSRLRPIPAIRSAIEAVTSRFGSPTIGVHVRRTDFDRKWESHGYPEVELYVSEMRKCLHQAPHATFFLSTDDDAILGPMTECLGHRVLSSSHILGRETPSRWTRAGQIAAVVDLFCLSRTDRLIGTRFSSFSYEAASLGSIPLTEISRDALGPTHPA